MKQMWVYILASRQNGTIYTGVTSDLVKRIHEHRTHATPGFTAKYDVAWSGLKGTKTPKRP